MKIIRDGDFSELNVIMAKKVQVRAADDFYFCVDSAYAELRHAGEYVIDVGEGGTVFYKALNGGGDNSDIEVLECSEDFFFRALGYEPFLNWIIKDIGDWNMYFGGGGSPNTKAVAHGLDDDKIVCVGAVIRNDNGTDFYPIDNLGSVVTGEMDGSVWTWGWGNVTLHRRQGGLFDSVSFNQLSYNRGIIKVGYID